MDFENYLPLLVGVKEVGIGWLVGWSGGRLVSWSAGLLIGKTL